MLSHDDSTYPRNGHIDTGSHVNERVRQAQRLPLVRWDGKIGVSTSFDVVEGVDDALYHLALSAAEVLRHRGLGHVELVGERPERRVSR